MSVHEDELLIGKYPYVPKQKRAQQKRNALLESGRVLFIEKGYEQTNAKEIASHAGVAIGTFYRYFSDKRQLMMSLLEDQIDSLLPPEPIWPTVDPEVFLATLLEQHFQQLDKLGLYRVLPELLLKDSQFAIILAEAKRKVHTRIHLSLMHAKELGIIWDDLDLDTVSWAIIALFEKIPEKQQDSGTQLDYHNVAKIICRFVFPPEILKQVKSEKDND